ncbi:Cytochrome P450 OS=Tsukamurella paurometabola (strain ATCC 8368 / DSM / CCUG 35730 / CIP 100753/ JCM 10117 / KCTC 9821 / NBRC 16120 / NCIMB 702349 / NCTC 13040) OX=521096 GN=Tpau_3652 PE=3 SV=1 [Tsukamurella paurometabola]|uniref:Cytochrome P450 n=1 Tax=Tsukamurella paurometabola (strain ATCC 8368 / DSM 20162 / CCUG 35730 / CIP 100753 / JCM 10117 / KCTC 9821 / NBRC 16120 / NCIMB 702349 / NCTC 13040) TaxID=521096 RepID=D5UXZ3_TSUPD|nr:cytochrome P450 [Tsukamurella paurometabola]ADG80230.1 cytochrome P450 [Tsukamurella paurometabola DSM 20162]SUP38929.1 Biotin biosynthesis cytochrome P450 [Tsukamurella paurometabola]
MRTGAAVALTTRVRWAIMHGLPRYALPRRAARGDVMAQMLLGYAEPGSQYAQFDRLREAGTLVRSEVGITTADHHACREILRDKRFRTVQPTDFGFPGPLRRVLELTELGLPNPVEPPSMLVSEPPAHTAYRHPIARSFTPKAIEQLTDRARTVSAQLLDAMAAKDSPDLVIDYAARLPVAMIGRLLGLPEADDDYMLEWGEAAAPLLDPGLSWPVYWRAVRALRGLDDYLTAHFARVTAQSGGDHPFALLAASGELTDRELVTNAALLIGAGFETTVNLIGNGIVALLDHPEQLARLRAEPDLWPNAVEEILRYSSPVQRTARIAAEDAEVLGMPVRAGTMISLQLAGANRDPAVFADPAVFDVARPEAKKHVSFGFGIHACIGAALARMEGAVALRALFERYPDLALDGAGTPRGLSTLYGYSSLPARL